MPEMPTGESITQAEGENDVLDLEHSPLAQNLGALIDQASIEIRTEAIESMKAKANQAPAATPVPTTTPLPAAGPVPAQPITASPKPPAPAPSISVTPPVPNDILKLATERDDLTVSQLAAQATRVVPLTEGESVTLRNGKTNTPVPDWPTG